MSQRDTVLRMLQDAGENGVHTFEMRRAFIGNPSERIRELEDDGYTIFKGPRERLNGASYGVRYKLADPSGKDDRQAPPAPQGALSPALDGTSSGGAAGLFDLPARQGSAYDLDDAA